MKSEALRIPSPDFPTAFSDIDARLRQFDPLKYGATRNFTDGAVSYLSPYISRGVISTRQVLESILNRGFDPGKCEKFIQELAWRDYWQTVWEAKGDSIETDLQRAQPNTENNGVPRALIESNTGILTIDQGIDVLYQSGYMHNHMRMYVAALTCNVGHYHWKEPARWMYYHLLDGDWASNTLSWQWVAGSNSNKQYYADQRNINKFTGSSELNTYLDRSYEELSKMSTPQELMANTTFTGLTILPETALPLIKDELPLLLYHPYNLDPTWRKNEAANRVLILDPSHFARYPVSQTVLDFYLNLGENIPGLQVYCGSANDLVSRYKGSIVRFREHPFYKHLPGAPESREWLSSIRDSYPSFFKFWKMVRKDLGIF
ncbi:MAG: deoxyribodipyrimidine photolyase [Flavobacteriales bacterium]|nr:deoxyribodipyrimidine photolyase [Flavobacteriales bacterium]